MVDTKGTPDFSKTKKQKDIRSFFDCPTPSPKAKPVAPVTPNNTEVAVLDPSAPIVIDLTEEASAKIVDLVKCEDKGAPEITEVIPVKRKPGRPPLKRKKDQISEDKKEDDNKNEKEIVVIGKKRKKNKTVELDLKL